MKHASKDFKELLREAYLLPSASWDAITEILDRKGYKLVGGGYFSTVYQKPGSDRVVKLSQMEYDEDQDGWYYYAKWCMRVRKKSPNMPTIYALVVLKGGERFTDKYLSEIECLTPYNFRHEGYSILTSRRGKRYTRSRVTVLPPDIHAWVDRIIDKFGGKWTFDIHEDNVMRRHDGTMVVTDPISFPIG